MSIHRAIAAKRYFDEIGATAAKVWERDNYSRAVFAPIATDLLRERLPADEVDYRGVLDLVLGGDALPYQQYFESPFGQPPVTTYWHALFHIEVLFWTTATTTIHSHAFAGAFSPLEGASVQALYKWTSGEPVTDTLRLGQLSLTNTGVLTPKDVTTIEPGPTGIHTIDHLDVPGVTVVVRTRSEPADRKEYWPPHVERCVNHEDQRLTRRLQCLAVLKSSSPTSYATAAVNLIEHTDLVTAVHVLRQAVGGSLKGCAAETLMQAARLRWGRRIEPIAESISEDARRCRLAALRPFLWNSEARCVLALLMSQCDRRSLFALLRQHVPHNSPAEVMSRWCNEMRRRNLLDLRPDALTEAIMAQWVCVDDERPELPQRQAAVVQSYGADAVLARLRELAQNDVLRSLVSRIDSGLATATGCDV